MHSSELDRKTRIAITIAISLVVAAPVLALHNWLSSLDEAKASVTLPGADDGLLKLRSGATIFLPEKGLSETIERWLNFGPDGVSDIRTLGASFTPGSSELNSEGRRQVEQLAQLLSADHALRARILTLETTAESSAIVELARARAERIRAELLGLHVPSSNVTLGRSVGDVPAEDPEWQDVTEIAVQLSR